MTGEHKNDQDLNCEVSNIAQASISAQIALEPNPKQLRDKRRPDSLTSEQQQRRRIHKSHNPIP